MRPRLTLAARLAALVAAVVIGAGLLHTALLLRLLPSPARQLAALGGQLALARAALAQVPAAGREALAGRLGLRPGPPLADALPPPEDGLEALTAELSAAAGAPVWLQPAPPEAGDEPALWLGVLLESRLWWLPSAVSVPPASTPWWSLALAMLGTGLAACVAALLGAQALTRPMAALARQLQARRAALRPLRLPATASRELAQIVQSFNELAAAQTRRQARRRQTLAGLSHDLRAPLARLRLRAECELDEQQRGRIEADIDALDHILGQFITFMESDEVEQAAGQPDRVAEVVRHALRPYQERQAIDWHCGPGDWAHISAPDLALQRLLGNLLDNALAHGRGRIHVELRADAQAWTLLVGDEGRGIAAAELGAALQPFVKLPQGRGREAGHCGLGLAIVAELVRALGGRLVHQPHDGRRWALGVSVPLQRV